MLKRAICFLGMAILMIFHTPVFAAEVPQTYSKEYVVMDAATGQVLIGQNERERAYPASITKVLTAAMALEKDKPEEKIVMSEEAVFSIDRSSTHIALTPGEEVTVEQMLYAAMLASANDAANALAEHAGGSIEAFVEQMNEKASQLGCTQTHFVNPSGLYDAQHYTTAYDFAQITRWALGVPGFREVFGKDEYRMAPTNKQPESRLFGTSNCLTVTSAYQYEGATGGKLGWTPESEHTITAVAHRGEMELVLVALGSHSKWDKFKDAVALYDYCFENFEKRAVQPAGAGWLPEKVPLAHEDGRIEQVVITPPTETIYADVPLNTPDSALKLQHNLPAQYQGAIEEEPSIGVYMDETLLYTLPLTYEIQSESAQTSISVEGEEADSAEKKSVPWWGYLLGIPLFLFIVLWLIRIYNLHRRRRRRRQRTMSRH